MNPSSLSFGANDSGLQAAYIQGPVHNQFHHHAAPPERRETPPNPSVIIPFPRDVDFVERGTILDQIKQRCSAAGSRTALVGLGGVGKSQLAIEYAYRTREVSPDTWVFWVHASNAARFEQSFREIADWVKVPGRKDLTANILQLVYEWLCDERKGKWVLILDNVDDAGFLVKGLPAAQDRETTVVGEIYSRQLVAYLPRCLHGSILVTTRSRDAALELVEPRNIVAVGPMEDKDALALFNKKISGHDGEDISAELVTALEYMPLAIVQAAAYITQRAPRYSGRQYLEDFRKNNRKRSSLLNYEGQQLRRDREAKNSIIITWQISFDHIREIRPSAADLLSLMSFFDRQGIPDLLLRGNYHPVDWQLGQNEGTNDRDTVITSGDSDSDIEDGTESDSPSSVSNEDFELDIVTLRNYSFVSASTNSVNSNDGTLEMHGLVQFAMREWLKAHQQLERWKQQFIKNLNAELPTGEYENWKTCQALFPHAQAALAQKQAEQHSLIEWAAVLYKAAWYAEEMGRWDKAEEMSMQALKVTRKLFGQDHPSTLTSMANLASTYRNQGRWKAAEELEVQVMETCKTKLGADHPDTLTSMNNLAFTWRGNGRVIEALRLMEECIKSLKRVLGLNHPNTLSSCAVLDTWKAEQDDIVLSVQSTESG